MSGLTDAKVLETCRKIEEGAARLYHLLARQQAQQAGISALWTKTAREEENHAKQLEMVQRRRGRMAVQIKVDLAKAESALHLIETAIEEAKRTPLSVQQALEEAIIIENTFMQFHADFAVQFTNTIDQQLFRSMMAADRDHVGTLQAALDSLAGR